MAAIVFKDENGQRLLEEYHHVWLAYHPERTEEWLLRMLREGFHLHHVDGDHANNDNLNLVLIEGGDHFLIHNGKKRLLYRPKGTRPVRDPSAKVRKKSLRQLRIELAAANAYTPEPDA